MTCDEFKKFNAGGVDGILALTRAERSDVAQHWAGCFECRDWTNGISLAMTPEQEVRVLQVCAEDRRDPETFRLDPAEAAKFDMDEATRQHTKKGK